MPATNKHPPTKKKSAKRLIKRAARKLIPKPKAQTKTVRGPPRRFQTQSNLAGAAISMDDKVVNQATVSMEAFGNLSPLAQFQLTSLRPGLLNTPYVEYNGTPSKLPTTIAQGARLESMIATDAAKFTAITLCPIYGLSSAVPTSGLGVQTLADASAVTTALGVRGYAFSEVYGATTFTSKIVSYAARVSVTLMAPEATLSGSVYIGCLPVSAYIGSSTAALLDSATVTIDLKEKSSWDLRSCISNRNLVHDAPPLTAGLQEEWVSYAIISQSPAKALDGTGTIPYSLEMKAHSNAIWWPIVSTPILNAIATKPVETNAPETRTQSEFSNAASSATNAPVPTTKDKIFKIIDVLLKGASAVPMLGAFSSVARGVVSAVQGALSDPLDNLPDTARVISDTDWYMVSALSRWPHYENPLLEDAVNEWFSSCNNLLSVFRNASDRIAAIKKSANVCKAVVHRTREGSSIKYYLPGGKEWDVLADLNFRSVMSKAPIPTGFIPSPEDEDTFVDYAPPKLRKLNALNASK